MRLLVLLVTVIGCAWLAVGNPNPGIGGGDDPAPPDCGCCDTGSFGTGAVEVHSLSVTINLGSAAFPGALSGGSLHLYAQAPSAQLATPEALTWTFGTRILFVSADKTAGGEPREVTMEDRDGRQVKFRFEDGSAWAYPQGKFRDTSRRLFMVDANGVAVTQNPAWYDLAYGNGNVDRFAAQPDAAGIRPLAAVYVAGGRWLTIANSGLDVVRDTANALLQIKTANTLADIVTETDRKYRIDFYAIADVQKTGSLYVPGGTPKVTWTIENPSASSVDRLTITRTISGSTKVYDAQYTPYLGRWVMTAPGDLLKEESYSFWDASETIREEHRNVLNQAGQVVQHSIKKWQKFAWEQAVVAEIDDPDGAAMTTTNTYYTNPAENGRYSRLKTVLNADGSWTRYDYDGTGRTIEEVRPFGDSPLTAENAQARVTTYSYTPLDNDTAILGDQRPRTVIETALGQEVSRTYHAYTLVAGEQVEIVEQCAQPGAAYEAASNQRTVSRHYAATNTAALAGLLRRIERPDGTTASYDYTFGTYTAAQKSFTAGAGTAYRVMVTDGTMDHPEGIANKTTRKTTVYDNRGFNVLSETWVFAGGTNYSRVAWTVREFDAFGHATTVLYSNGLREDAKWDDCCGKSAEFAADGVRRDYAYDELGRLKILRITTGTDTDLLEVYDYDAAGARVSVTRQAGDLSLTSRQRYDLAGRLTNSVDEAGLSTFYVHDEPARRSTVILPGGLTNATVRYPDGRTRYTEQNGIRQTTYAYGLDLSSPGCQITTAYTGPLGTNSPVWQKSVTDLLGRTIRTERPGFGGTVLATVNSYDAAGRLCSSVSVCDSAILSTTLYAYDSLGQPFRSGLDINTNGVLDLSGLDRVSESYTSYQSDGSDYWQVSASILYPHDGSAAPVTNSIQRTRLTGLGAAMTVTLDGTAYTGILMAQSISKDLLGNTSTNYTVFDDDFALRVGLVSTPDSTNAAITVSINGLAQYSISKTGVRTDAGYDALGRQILIQNNTGDRQVAQHTHYNSLGQVDWVADALANRTTFVYEATTGQRISVTDALSNTVHTAYDPEGRVIATWGATYPVAYEYDAYGRMTAMGTYRGTNVITSAADLFTLPTDQTTWSYDESTGLLTNKVYADGKGPSYTYTPDGKLTSRTWARGVTTTYNYTNTTGELIGIDYSDATPDVAFAFNRIGQPITITDATGTRSFSYNDAFQLAAETNAFGAITRQYDSFGRSSGLAVGADYQVGYGYSGDGRFASVTSSVQSVSSVVSYSYLPDSGLISGWSNGILSTVRNYEAHRDLLTAVENQSGASIISRFDYQNDAIARRTQRIDSGSAIATNQFGYNPRSELTNAAMGTNAYGYAYDGIGNRMAASANASTNRYAANALNQYTNITAGSVVVPRYDLDGNLTNYNGWSFAWDGENRLVLALNAATVVSNCYDYMSRRVQKIVGSSTNTFQYDDWAMVRETTGTQTNSYVYGLDLSGSLQGAGGIGGLLAAHIFPLPLEEGQGEGSTVFPCYDANGNVSDLVATNGTSLAHYEWDPYGNATVRTGSLAAVNPFRFSTKYTDDETGLLYYGFRYYSPGLGRWLNRDPTQEDNGKHLYSFCENNGIRQIDYLGLWIIEHRSSDAYAVARKEAGDSIGSLSIKTGLYASDILGWAKKTSDGTSFESYDEVSRACDIYLPNRILLILPKATRPSGWWRVNPFSWERYAMMLGLRASLNSLGSRWENANFMVEKVDYQDELTTRPTNSQLSWPLLGLMIGGHGDPPLDAFIEGAPRPGSVGVSDDEDSLAPSDFVSASRQYHFQTLVVFACWAGMGGWDELAIGPQAIISISPRRPVLLTDFPYGLYPNRWE